MRDFNIIQAGEFCDKVVVGRNSKIGVGILDDIVELRYRSSSEFQFDAISKAFVRIMKDFEQYKLVFTDISTTDGKVLVVLCREDRKIVTVNAIKEFLDSPWPLKEYSGLDNIQNLSSEEMDLNFWWCIDIAKNFAIEAKDWIAFLEPNKYILYNKIKSAYNIWWMEKTEEQQKSDYVKALR